ncbi:Saccharopine dehydrogenase, NADP-dependent [Seinonella peptonophila]|uniref:Saccharopine dehydrogenase, NADP-dependent n=1 Tax=Seinonella peptonophila TaxID=112248 RepID=A0A1M4SMF7_9BACL|nr:saccharopine dehydrogenase C-terminal domain-containing protein [Seinonella peptonophila]SHE33454.1 Saccharopine dehydrogenase, NADP-dependent [Seinonella peptonophila]
MKVAVIGGAGKVVWGAIRDFVEHPSVDELLLADLNLEAIEQRRQHLGSDKVKVERIDLNDHQALVRLLDAYDVCLNATSHHFNLKVMEACIESRTHYTDFGGLFHWALKQLEFHDRFKEAGITGIVGSGSAPGIVNVMARYGYDHLDQVHSIKILDGIVNFNAPEDSFIPPYAIETLIEEFVMNPYEFRDGKYVEMTPFSGQEEIDFPDPVGKQTVFNTIHSEVATMPLTFQDKGIQNVAFKLSLPKRFEERLRFLVNLGMGSKEPIQVRDQQVIPLQVLSQLVQKQSFTVPDGEHDDHKALRVEITGVKDGIESKYVLHSVLHPYKPWSDMSQGVFSVGFPAAVTTRLIGSEQIKEPGFFPTEAAIPPKIYFRELAQRGIVVQSQFTQTL